MTLAELTSIFRLSTRTGRAQLHEQGIADRTFRRWASGSGSPFRAVGQLLRVALNARPAQPPMLHVVVDGVEIVVMRRADLDALLAPKPTVLPLTHKQRIALSHRRN